MDYFPQSLSLGRSSEAAHTRDALVFEDRSLAPANSASPRSSSWSNGIRFEALANLAHELRTPVQVLLGYLDILRDQQSSEGPGDGGQRANRNILERMNTNVHELAHTVENVLEFALTLANAEPAIEEEIDLVEFFSEVEQFLDAARPGPNLALRIKLNDAPSTFVTRRRALRSIVLNLASNAIKFTADGEVTICASRGGENSADLDLEVRDTGLGISGDLLSSAFEPLVQLSNCSIRRHRGLGLGLTLVQRNVKALGGRLSVESVPGAGSCFKVTIPSSGQCSGSGPSMCTSSHSADNLAC